MAPLNVLEQGMGPLFSDPDPNPAREFFATRSRRMDPKLMSAAEAVRRFIPDGCYLGIGGFGVNRIPTAILHEIVRQGRKNLGFAGHTSTHDFQILCAGKCLDRVDVAYVVGLEARGLSPNARRVMESGTVQVCEWTNYGLALRLRAAAMGIPFLVGRSMLGTDTFRHSAAKVVECPFTGQRVTAFPALYPDVSAIHVHEADIYGNSRIRGITVADEDLARASKRLIITCERIVSNDDIRSDPSRTNIPFYMVDAVVEVPYGSFPGNMPYEYYSDEAHLQRWLQTEQDPAAFAQFLDEYIFGVKDFSTYLERCGGIERMRQLRALEFLNDAGELGGRQP